MIGRSTDYAVAEHLAGPPFTRWRIVANGSAKRMRSACNAKRRGYPEKTFQVFFSPGHTVGDCINGPACNVWPH